MSGSFLFQAVVYLTAAVVCVPVAKRLGLGSVLGYLLAGIIIGPFILGFIGEEGEDVMHFAEFGVVMMLFLIGLELEPNRFIRMWKSITGLGGMQLGITALALFGALSWYGFDWRPSLALALALGLSSTAIVLQTLKEKGLMKTRSGQGSFAVLLFQDIAVIPILAILPLLAVSGSAVDGHDQHSLMEDLPGWLQTLAVLGSVGVVIFAGRYLIVPALRLVSKTRLRELFTASALLIVVAIAFLMETVGLSPALGTFLAGVVLANSEFRHELESDLEPFKGLLLGLFFIAVGASINFGLIGARPVEVVTFVVGIMALKFVVLLLVGKTFRFSTDQNLMFAVGLSQVGEFAFVLVSFMSQLNILNREWVDMMLAVTAISMTITPLLILVNDRLVLPRVGTQRERDSRPMDEMEEDNQVILVGFAHYGSNLGRFLRAHGVEATILDNDSDRVDLLRKMGFKVYYGDATRYDLLLSAGAEKASILVSAIGDLETNYRLVETVNKHFPNLRLMLRARNRYDAYELLELGIDDIYRQSLDTSVRMGVDVLHKLGFRRYSVYRSAQDFIKYDEASLRKLAKERHNKERYISSVREEIDGQEKLLRRDREFKPSTTDHSWDSEEMRQEVNKQQSNEE